VAAVPSSPHFRRCEAPADAVRCLVTIGPAAVDYEAVSRSCLRAALCTCSSHERSAGGSPVDRSDPSWRRWSAAPGPLTARASRPGLTEFLFPAEDCWPAEDAPPPNRTSRGPAAATMNGIIGLARRSRRLGPGSAVRPVSARIRAGGGVARASSTAGASLLPRRVRPRVGRYRGSRSAEGSVRQWASFQTVVPSCQTVVLKV